MRRRSLPAAAGALAIGAIALFGGSAARGDRDAGANGAGSDAVEAGDARRDLAVATFGARKITVGELEDRLAELAPFQRAAYGATAAEIRRRFLDEVLVPDALLVAAAQDTGLAARPPASYAIERARSEGVVRAVRERVGPADRIPMDDVRAYYDAHRDRYSSPEKLLLWRILCATRDEALAVLAAAKADPTPHTFGELAREHSLDKGTNLRAGNLGFLTPDGAAADPGLRVDPALLAAARGVRDGELVAAPVAEGPNFAVVWRRGSIAATSHGVDEVAPQIRDAIWKDRVRAGTEAELARLRVARVRDLDESPLVTLDLEDASR
jgi:peptidyl-prolyl cis-trans isomerase C